MPFEAKPISMEVLLDAFHRQTSKEVVHDKIRRTPSFKIIKKMGDKAVPSLKATRQTLAVHLLLKDLGHAIQDECRPSLNDQIESS